MGRGLPPFSLEDLHRCIHSRHGASRFTTLRRRMSPPFRRHYRTRDGLTQNLQLLPNFQGRAALTAAIFMKEAAASTPAGPCPSQLCVIGGEWHQQRCPDGSSQSDMQNWRWAIVLACNIMRSVFSALAGNPSCPPCIGPPCPPGAPAAARLA